MRDYSKIKSSRSTGNRPRTINVNPELDDKVQALCAAQRVSMSDVFRHALELMFSNSGDSLLSAEELCIRELREELRVLKANQAYEGWMKL